jgi:hypothetical protein
MEVVRQGGPESEAAAQAAASLGARGAKALQDLMPQVAPGLRRRIAAALGGGGTASAEHAALDALLDSDPGVVDAAVRALVAQVPTLTPTHRKSLADSVLDMLKSRKDARRPLAAEVALVRLLAALHDPRSESLLWARLEPSQPAELRVAALTALGTLPPPTQADRIRRLLACAVEADFRIVAPALVILKSIEVSGKLVPDWLILLDAPDLATRRFILDKLADRDDPALVAALLRQLRHPDRGWRDEAARRLASSKRGRAALADALVEAPTPDDAWAFARAQSLVARELDEPLQERLFQTACRYLDQGDRRADAFLSVLREANPRALRDRLEERALALRKKKNYPAALVYFRLLARDPACSEEIRFEHAACGLKVSAKDLAPDARAADPCLGQFAALVHRSETSPLARLEKAKWLDAEDLFYLGFHLIEGTGRERELGGRLLELVAKKQAKTKLGKDARSKLRSQGFG